MQFSLKNLKRSIQIALGPSRPSTAKMTKNEMKYMFLPYSQYILLSVFDRAFNSLPNSNPFHE
jgi:hypothetical protein